MSAIKPSEPTPDEVLRRMLNTPPKPHKPDKPNKPSKAEKPKTKKPAK